ncbi:MAG: polysaccharide biosynthesis/export family protein [Verrucomicrobiota bacterium]|jgi:protein involved in polysaccharide export with SLBB domain
MPRNFCTLVAALAVAAVLAGCGTDKRPAQRATPPGMQTQPPGANPMVVDPLRVGDKIRIALVGMPDSKEPTEQEVKDDGTVSVDFIGRIKAEGKTPGELQKEIQELLVPKYFTHLTVLVDTVARWIYVSGEITMSGMGGGRVLYSGPITVTRAIAAAGDFSPFANKKHVRLTRVDKTVIIVNCKEALENPNLDPPVFPGDQIYVPRRFY